MVKTICIFIVLLYFVVSPLNVFAQEESDIPNEYDDMLDSLPNDIADMLPDEIFSDDINSIAQGTKELTSWDYIFNTVFDILGLNIKTIVKSLATIIGILVLCALLNMLKNTMKSAAIERILNLISIAALVLVVLKISYEPLQKAMQLLQEMRVFTNTISPVMCSIYAMGGNVSNALVHNYGLIVFLSILENICIVALESILGVCLGLTIASSFIDESNLLPLNNAIKKAFTFVVGIMMLVFTTVISTQTLLASKADTLTSKTAKMLASQIIPVVGGTIGETLRTAGASIEYLRSNVGIALVVTFILLVLPTIISIGLYRMVFIITNSLAGLLGCKKEGNIISELASIYGYVLAILCFCSLTLLFILTIFAKCASPLS